MAFSTSPFDFRHNRNAMAKDTWAVAIIEQEQYRKEQTPCKLANEEFCTMLIPHRETNELQSFAIREFAISGRYSVCSNSKKVESRFHSNAAEMSERC
jgi:hypothetical protein